MLEKVERLAKWDQNDLPDADSGMQQIWRDGYECAIENLREALKSENYIAKAEAAE